MMCRGHGVPRTTAVFLGFLNLNEDNSNEDNSSFARFFKLDKYAMFSFAMTRSDSDKFKIIIALRRAQKFGDMGLHKNFVFLINPFLPEFFLQF